MKNLPKMFNSTRNHGNRFQFIDKSVKVEVVDRNSLNIGFIVGKVKKDLLILILWKQLSWMTTHWKLTSLMGILCNSTYWIRKPKKSIFSDCKSQKQLFPKWELLQK